MNTLGWLTISILPSLVTLAEKPKGRSRPGRPFLWQAPDGADRVGDQRLENWKLRRAFMRPYFLRSTTRLSRVRNPTCLRILRSAGS